MLQIKCPYCQELREEDEFSYGGEAHIERHMPDWTARHPDWSAA